MLANYKNRPDIFYENWTYAVINVMCYREFLRYHHLSSSATLDYIDYLTSKA